MAKRKFEKVSILTGKLNVMELDVTDEQERAWQRGQLIQHAMPHLTDDEREFLVNGITPEEWAAFDAADEDSDAIAFEESDGEE